MRARRLAAQAIFKLFAEVDVLLAASRLAPAPKVSEPLDHHPDRPVPQNPGLTSLVPAGNLAGMPALSLPCGFTGNLPVAIQLVGLPYSENTLLAIRPRLQHGFEMESGSKPGAAAAFAT